MYQLAKPITNAKVDTEPFRLLFNELFGRNTVAVLGRRVLGLALRRLAFSRTKRERGSERVKSKCCANS